MIDRKAFAQELDALLEKYDAVMVASPEIDDNTITVMPRSSWGDLAGPVTEGQRVAALEFEDD